MKLLRLITHMRHGPSDRLPLLFSPFRAGNIPDLNKTHGYILLPRFLQITTTTSLIIIIPNPLSKLSPLRRHTFP
jgi:hypothetical protein